MQISWSKFGKIQLFLQDVWFDSRKELLSRTAYCEKIIQQRVFLYKYSKKSIQLDNLEFQDFITYFCCFINPEFTLYSFLKRKKKQLIVQMFRDTYGFSRVWRQYTLIGSFAIKINW